MKFQDRETSLLKGIAFAKLYLSFIIGIPYEGGLSCVGEIKMWQ